MWYEQPCSKFAAKTDTFCIGRSEQPLPAAIARFHCTSGIVPTDFGMWNTSNAMFSREKQCNTGCHITRSPPTGMRRLRSARWLTHLAEDCSPPLLRHSLVTGFHVKWDMYNDINSVGLFRCLLK